MQISIILAVVMLVIIVMIAISVAVASRSKARKEIYKRSIAENNARLHKAIYVEKEKLLKSKLESKDNVIETLNEKICALIAKCTSIEDTKRLEIESRDNKLEFKNAEITMLKHDCSRLQDNIVEINKRKDNGGA